MEIVPTTIWRKFAGISCQQHVIFNYFTSYQYQAYEFLSTEISAICICIKKDMAHLYLNGVVNKQNAGFWVTKNPHVNRGSALRSHDYSVDCRIKL
jgi:hypothetical protein